MPDGADQATRAGVGSCTHHTLPPVSTHGAARDVLSPMEFFGLVPGRHLGVFMLPVTAGLSSGTGALFGGVALGSVAAVVERVTGRSLVWATVQFAHHVRPPALLELRVTEHVRGWRASQVGVVACLDDRAVFTAMGAAGERDAASSPVGWAVRPQVPDPEDCRPRVPLARHRGRFMERTEVRLARARPSGGRVKDGRSSVWARVPGLAPGSPTLGILGDYVPFGVRQCMGDRVGTHSLDNTVRVLGSVGAGWILADIAVAGISGGFGHGRVHLWGEDGRLLGTASQSFTCRPR